MLRRPYVPLQAFKMAGLASLYRAVVLFLWVTLSSQYELVKLGEIKVPLAGFSNIFVHEDATDPLEKYSIILSTFNPIPFTRDTSYMYRHIGKFLDNLAEVKGLALDKRLTWPREPRQIPSKCHFYNRPNSTLH